MRIHWPIVSLGAVIGMLEVEVAALKMKGLPHYHHHQPSEKQVR